MKPELHVWTEEADRSDADIGVTIFAIFAPSVASY
jgi:hypothetical protein